MAPPRHTQHTSKPGSRWQPPTCSLAPGPAPPVCPPPWTRVNIEDCTSDYITLPLKDLHWFPVVSRTWPAPHRTASELLHAPLALPAPAVLQPQPLVMASVSIRRMGSGRPRPPGLCTQGPFYWESPNPLSAQKVFFSSGDPAQMSPALGNLSCLFPSGCSFRGPLSPFHSLLACLPPVRLWVPKSSGPVTTRSQCLAQARWGKGVLRKHWLRVDMGGGLSLEEKVLCTPQTHCKPSRHPWSFLRPPQTPLCCSPKEQWAGSQKATSLVDSGKLLPSPGLSLPRYEPGGGWGGWSASSPMSPLPSDSFSRHA